MILLQESDELAYRCAFACEKQAYRLTWIKSGKVEDYENKYTKTEIIKMHRENLRELDIHYTLEGYKLVDPEPFVYQTVEKYIDRLWCLEHEAWGTPVEEVELWLSPSDRSNFRHNVANIAGRKGLGYKAGRGQKPHYLSLIRELLLDEYGAKVIKGFESDDALGIYANEYTILSHQDKDINSVGGCWHFNHVTGEIYYVPNGLGTIELDKKKKCIGRGLLYFYVQLLTGDDIDNIRPCLNPAKAHHSNPPAFSDSTAVELLQDSYNEEAAFRLVKEMYTYTYKDMWKDALEENADLLWICRSYDETGRQYLKNRGFI